ncbi:hypothetical protein NKR23_g10330 [Pleurostoma richardsiae]|uniref:CFEM domain-containing protein n=1 Tax=Pleurostoma richardsiae TaxID=41990 RepID=A0AA38VBX7_9PEZI|nr:hypothetical protein NKR23_g10330 [Pleurostoma richardsiae]
MKTSVLSLAVFAGLAAAQFTALPSCAQNCASEQFSGSGYAGCGTDPKCICQNQNFLSTIACCLEGVCDASDQAAAVAFAQQICSAQGVSVPTVVSCTSTSGLASGTASSSPATATAATTTSGSASAAATTGASSSGGSSSAATGTAANASSGSSASGNWGPKQTPALGMGALGGLVAGLALL